MTRVRDELRQLEEQRVAQEEARQEEEQKNQRLAAEFQQQLSEWQQSRRHAEGRVRDNHDAQIEAVVKRARRE